MKTRCPHCQTLFKITNEQLKIHSGQVRCGNCKKLFNAFDALNQVEIDSINDEVSVKVTPKNDEKIKLDFAENFDEVIEIKPPKNVSKKEKKQPSKTKNNSKDIIKKVDEAAIKKADDEELKSIEKSLSEIDLLLSKEDELKTEPELNNSNDDNENNSILNEEIKIDFVDAVDEVETKSEERNTENNTENIKTETEIKKYIETENNVKTNIKNSVKVNVNNVNNVNNTENNVIEKGLVGIILAAFGLGIWGYLSTNIPHFMWIDSERAWNGFSNPIPYGLICIMFAVMALIFPFSIIQKYYKNCKFLKFLKFLQSEQVFLSIKILAFLAGLYGAYQSGSRIALLVFPLFIFVAVYTKTTLNKRQKFLYLCGFLVLVSTPLLVFNNKFSNRIQDGFNDIEKYKSVQNINKETLSKNNNYNTSMGLRFVMWSEAMKIIKTDNNWIFGIGRSNFMPTMIKLHSEGKVVDEIRATPHPHSEYFNSFVEFGIFGLVSLLLIYLFPLLFYCNKRYLQHKDEAVKFAARSGIILSSGYTIAGIFDCYFWIVSLVNFYILTNVIFMSLILSKTAKLKE